MPSDARLERLTFLLLKEGLNEDDALLDKHDLSAHVVPPLTTTKEVLFVHAPPIHPPRWRQYLERHVRNGLGDLHAAGASAVLFLEVKDRTLAVTFGGGRHLIDQDTIEEGFGLKVVLNTVDPEKLRSVDAKNIDETTMHTRRDVSRESTLRTFGLDVTQDLVRAVTGTPRDETLAHRLTGSDALGVTSRTQVPELPALAGRLLEAYGSTDYRQNFEFIDYLRAEDKRARVAELNQLLVDAINNRDIDGLHLAAPEALDWMDILGFRFTSSDNLDVDSDPRISRYLESKSDPLTLDDLKSDRLVALRASDGRVADQWSVLKSVVFELEEGEDMFVHSGGRWFRVNRDFKDRVLAEVATLPEFDGLPEADAGTNEDAYNEKAASTLAAVCLDKKFVFDEGPDKMEICDVLTSTGTMIHVKQRGSSSTLSHLFAQGVNSAERLLGDPDFRSKARTVVAGVDGSFADVIPIDRPDPSGRAVVFAVISRSRRDTPLTLPFFSVLSLRAAVQRLRALGCPVAVATVREATE
jgi:uncharacterized protein (TIGR04141 family)